MVFVKDHLHKLYRIDSITQAVQNSLDRIGLQVRLKLGMAVFIDVPGALNNVPWSIEQCTVE